MPVKNLKEFLDKNHVNYTSLLHAPAFTAQEIAAAAHISGKQFAKIVIVKMNGQYAMVILSADEYLNVTKLKEKSGVSKIDLVNEMEFKDKFPGCEVGAMPPFGNLYGMPVYMASSMCKQSQIAFNAGSHSELLKLSVNDFERLVKPKIVSI